MTTPESAPEIVLSSNAQTILDGVEKLNVMELADLVKALEKKFGVSAAAPVAVAATAASAAPAAVEEKTQFNAILTEIGNEKIKVIKEVRAVTSLGLKEAKDFVDGTLPATIKENVSMEEAKKIKEQVESAGAKVEIK